MLLGFRRVAKLAVAVMVFAAAAAGCAKSQPPPFVSPPGVQSELTHFAGSPLSGPTTRPIAAVPPQQALAVRVRFVLLERMPAQGVPLAGQARLIAAERLGTPVLPSNRLTSAARTLDLPDAAQFQTQMAADAGRMAPIAESRAALPRGVTAAFTLADPAPLNPQLTGQAAAHRLQLLVYRPLSPASRPASRPASAPANAETLELAVVVEDLAPLPREVDRTSEGEKDAAPAVPEILQRELAFIDRSIADHADLALIVPFKLAGSEGQAVAAIVDIATDPGSPEQMAALSRTIEDGKRSADRAARLPTALSTGSDPASSLAASLDGMRTADRRRAAIVYLAGQTGAHLCEDAALVADEATLANLVEKVRLAAAPPPPTTVPSTHAATAPAAISAPVAALPTIDPKTLGWQLERLTLDLLSQLMSDNKLSPELQSVLVAHLGEAGRHPSSLEELRGGMSSREIFTRRLIDENVIYLEDSAPSARVRAFDWLAARKLAPAGFDPLGSPKNRRLAIEQYLSNPPAAPAVNGL